MEEKVEEREEEGDGDETLRWSRTMSEVVRKKKGRGKEKTKHQHQQMKNKCKVS